MKLVLEIGQIHTMGALLVETWRTVSDRPPPFGCAGSNPAPPYTQTNTHFPGWRLQGQPDRHLLAPISGAKGVLLEGFGQAGKAHPSQTNCLKASAHLCLVSRSLYFSALLSTRRLRQRVGRYQRTGRRGGSPPTPHRSERLKFWFVLIRVNSSFVLHRSFAAPTHRPSPKLSKGFFLSGCGFRNTSFKMEVHYC